MRARLAFLGIAAALALAPAAALAHGLGQPEPTFTTLLTNWEFDPLFMILTGIISWLYYLGVRRVNRLHPGSRYPRKRVAYFYAGIGVLVFALISPFASYDTTLFSLHMVQHLLLTMVAAPLLLLGTPVTLALRAATPHVRKHILLPILHSSVVKWISFPVVAWFLFTVVMWGSHFSVLYEDALEHIWVHRLEHFLYLTTALMFWWQAIGVDPTPWRMSHPVRLLYLFLQMPQGSFLGVSIYGSESILYKHYETLQRTWGPSPLVDQQSAGLIMWMGGDFFFLFAMACVLYGWVKHEELEAIRQDRMLDRQRAAAEVEGPASV